MNYGERIKIKNSITDIFKPFVEIVGVSSEETCDILFERYQVVRDELLDKNQHSKVFEYFKSKLIPHKIEVFKAGIELSESSWFENLNVDGEEFFDNLWLHDLSKFSIQESISYANHDFTSIKTSIQFDRAWVHHKNHNPHHPEYWLNPSKGGKLTPLPMPTMFIIEMIADWIGAGRTYGNELETWLPDNLHKFLWHEETATNVKFILEKLGFKVLQNENQLCIGEVK